MSSKGLELAIKLKEIDLGRKLDKIEKETKDKQDLYEDVQFILKSNVVEEKEEKKSVGGPLDTPKKYKKKEEEPVIKKLGDLN